MRTKPYYYYYPKSPRPQPKQDKPLANPKTVDIKKIIHNGSCKTMVAFQLSLPVQYPCFKIVKSLSTVKIESLKSCRDAIIIEGQLSKTIIYTTIENCYISDYQLYAPDSSSFGAVRYISKDIPFSCLAHATCIIPEDIVEVSSAYIEDSSIIDTLLKPVNMIPKPVLFNMIEEQAVINIDYTILKNSEIKI